MTGNSYFSLENPLGHQGSQITCLYSRQKWDSRQNHGRCHGSKNRQARVAVGGPHRWRNQNLVELRPRTRRPRDDRPPRWSNELVKVAGPWLDAGTAESVPDWRILPSAFISGHISADMMIPSPFIISYTIKHTLNRVIPWELFVILPQPCNRNIHIAEQLTMVTISGHDGRARRKLIAQITPILGIHHSCNCRHLRLLVLGYCSVFRLAVMT